MCCRCCELCSLAYFVSEECNACQRPPHSLDTFVPILTQCLYFSAATSVFVEHDSPYQHVFHWESLESYTMSANLRRILLFTGLSATLQSWLSRGSGRQRCA